MRLDFVPRNHLQLKTKQMNNTLFLLCVFPLLQITNVYIALKLSLLEMVNQRLKNFKITINTIKMVQGNCIIPLL